MYFRFFFLLFCIVWVVSKFGMQLGFFCTVSDSFSEKMKENFLGTFLLQCGHLREKMRSFKECREEERKIMQTDRQK